MNPANQALKLRWSKAQRDVEPTNKRALIMEIASTSIEDAEDAIFRLDLAIDWVGIEGRDDPAALPEDKAVYEMLRSVRAYLASSSSASTS